MNNMTHEDLGDMLFREMQSANNLIGCRSTIHIGQVNKKG